MWPLLTTTGSCLASFGDAPDELDVAGISFSWLKEPVEIAHGQEATPRPRSTDLACSRRPLPAQQAPTINAASVLASASIGLDTNCLARCAGRRSARGGAGGIDTRAA